MTATTALYRHYDGEDTLLYIGISIKPLKRTSQHLNAAYWNMKIARIEIEQFPWRWLAEEAEKIAIATERPLFNITHKPNQGAVLPSASAGVAPGPRETITHQYRDPEKRKAYMRKYMKDRRAKQRAQRERVI